MLLLLEILLFSYSTVCFYQFFLFVLFLPRVIDCFSLHCAARDNNPNPKSGKNPLKRKVKLLSLVLLLGIIYLHFYIDFSLILMSDFRM